MDNLALSNAIPSPVSSGANVANGGVQISDTDDASASVSFGDVLTQQLAISNSRLSPKMINSLLSQGEKAAQSEKIVQPIDIIGQIIDPLTLNNKDSVVLVASQDVDPKLSSTDSLKKTIASDDKVISGDTSDFNQLTAGQAIVAQQVDTTQQVNFAAAALVVSGNLQPALSEQINLSGKDLPVPIAGKSSPTVPEIALQTNSQTEVSNAEVDAAVKFALKLDSAIQEDKADKKQDAQISNNTIVSHVVEKVSNSAPTSAGIPQQVGSPHWDTGLGDKVVWMIGSQTQSAQLHLNPPNLGPLEIKLSLSDGQTSLSFVTQHMTVKDAIEAASPRLREMMGDSGINMGSVSVNVGSFTQQQPNQQNAYSSPASTEHSVAETLGLSETESVSAVTQSLSDVGLVNEFA